ncbi:hypothetical protein HYT25_04860 [Candidatus Pacearchaeota archaeon]|nr:hypothetical protein [Candidatus Pacearchaeota archaeon]
MPYITQGDKNKYESILRTLRNLINKDTKKGELTYLVYALGLEFFKGRKSYTNISTAISSLQDAAEELRRRHLNPYEDRKIEENGDVI